ncbi:hypothetical protein Tco_0179010 [Tanacetum coccineum]
MEMKDTLTSCLDSEEQQMQQIQDKAKESCMVSFRRLHSYLKILSNNDLKGTRTDCRFKRAFATLFGQDVETFTGIMFLNVDQLEKQLDKEEFQEIGSMAAFKVLETQFQMFIKSQIYLDDEYVIVTRNTAKKEYDSMVNERQMQTTEEEDTSSRSRNDAHADDADIRPIYEEEPMAEEREAASAKPHHVIASSNSRNSSKNMPRFSSNDMVHNHYLEKAKNKTHDKGTSINVQEEQNLDFNAGTPFNLKKERIKVWIKENVISRKPSEDGNPSRANIKQALRWRWRHLIPAESDSLPHAHAQTTKTYYKHQDSRIKKAQEFKTKTFANSNKQDLPLRYEVYQRRLLARFQDDAKTDFASWQHRTIRDPIAERTKGAQQLGPERARVYSDLSPEDKDRYNADIQAINILLQGLPKDIYTLINHYTKAKDIWDHVKMLLDGSELMKEDRESQLYDDFENFRQNKGEIIHDYYVWFVKLINDRRNIKMTMSRMQLNLKFGRQNRGQGNNARGAGAVGYGGAQNRVRNANPGQARQIKCYNCNGGQDTTVDDDVDEQPVQDLALNMHNVFQADDYDAFDSDVDEAPTVQTMFMANLSTADPVYDEAGPSYDSNILSEVHDNDHYQDAVCEHHTVHEMHDDVQPNYVVSSHADYTSDSNMIPYD